LRPHCLNCGSPLNGPYCSKCGQHDVDYCGSFWHLTEDALEGALHYDGKFFKRARYIFTRPGFLTTEFVAGSYHVIAPHVLVDAPLVVKVFGID